MYGWHVISSSRPLLLGSGSPRRRDILASLGLPFVVLAADIVEDVVPGDTEALARYGVMLADEQLAKSPKAKFRALLVLNKVLYREPERHDVRRRVVRLSMDLGLFANARDDLENPLVPAFPGDAELQRLLGRCYEALGNYPKAREAYEQEAEIDDRAAELTRWNDDDRAAEQAAVDESARERSDGP